MSADQRPSINDYRRRVFGREPDQLIAFVCECGEASCHRAVLLTVEQYAQCRPGPILHQGHIPREDPDAVAASA